MCAHKSVWNMFNCNDLCKVVRGWYPGVYTKPLHQLGANIIVMLTTTSWVSEMSALRQTTDLEIGPEPSRLSPLYVRPEEREGG